MPTLDVEAVQAFVLVAEFQSFTRAAEALGTSQAAVSVKLKRLEDRLGAKLVERTPRRVRLSTRGAAFLAPAREFVAAHGRALAGLDGKPMRLALGITDQFSGADLPALLARLHAHDASLLIEVRIESSRSLLDAFDRGLLDAAIVRREDDRRDGDLLARERFGWFAVPGFVYQAGAVLRLASLAQTCGIRSAATRALDDAGIAWTEVFVGGGMAAVTAAVSAGLAVAALARSVAPSDSVEVGARFGLPALPPAEVVLHSTLSDTRSRAALRVLAAAFREHRASK
jgi:DNA-binding transcriptional LysR family regulator